MEINSIIIIIVIGAVAGWLAGKIMKGRGFGLLGNIVIGIIGSLVMSTVGAVVLLFVVRVLKKA